MKKQWTNKEVGRLFELYPSKLIDLVPEFPGRTLAAITHKASQLGIRRGKYPRAARTSMWKWVAAQHVPVIFGPTS